MEGCLFCKISAHEIPAKVIYEDDRVVAFLDIMPRATGHTMVIPKMHAANILELPYEQVEPLFAAVKHVAEMLSKTLQPDGLTIGINQGRASGQEVNHLHVHILPRWSNDGGSAIQSVVNKPPTDSLDALVVKITKGI